jgi:hypothetical protein
MILPLGHTALFETVRPMAVWDAPSPNEATRQGPTRIVCPQDLRDFKTIRPLLRKCRKPQEQRSARQSTRASGPRILAATWSTQHL